MTRTRERDTRRRFGAVALAAFLAMAGAADPPSAWVDRLAEESTRAQAIDALEAAGMAALPDLRRAVAEEGGETGQIAAELIRRIGARRLLRATPVSLNIEDRSVPEAVADLAIASGFGIDPPVLKDEASKDKKITLREPGTLGFLEALDRLGAEGGFRQDASGSWWPATWVRSPPRRGELVKLVPAAALPPPTSYAGPYRATLTGLYRSRTVAQVRAPAEAEVVESFRAEIEVTAEPGLLLLQNGPIRVREAVDDRGQVLRPIVSAPPNPSGQDLFPWDQDRLGALLCALPLVLPDDRGAILSRLRGFVPVIAVTRTDELFSCDFADLNGKALSGGGVTLTVSRASFDNQVARFALEVRGEPATAPIGFASGPRQMTQAILSPAFNLVDHLRVEDAEGRAFPIGANPSGPPRPDGSVTFHVEALSPGAAPAKLRYFAVAAVATEIPFDFRDLPIP